MGNKWIEIKQEADLPKENLSCWFIYKENVLEGNYSKEDNDFSDFFGTWFEPEEISHYMKKQQPEPPIF